jgi:hypothetical protein
MKKKRTKEEFWKEMRPLMERYNQLGRLLPKVDEFTTVADFDVHEARVLLAEMRKVQAQIDALLGRGKSGRGPPASKLTTGLEIR